MIKPFFAVILFFSAAAPHQITVTWQDKKSAILMISYDEDSSEVKECIDTGFVFEQRFLMRACEDSYDSWFSNCQRERKKIHKIAKDPIRKEYLVITDLHGDTPGPDRNSFKTLTEALEYFKVARDIPLEHIQLDEFNKTSLAVRIISSCKGEYSETLAQLSYLFTLGIIDLGGEDTGWIDFDLKKSEPSF